MVELDCLAAFDCLQWLRTGDRAAQLLGCNQSTVSRATRKCEEAFLVRISKREAEWQIVGDASLLNAERVVHQAYRWGRGLPLRLESQHWLQPSYGELDLPGWQKGNFNYLEYERPLQLLRDRVIDAWLCSAPDRPQADDLACIELCTMPAWLVVRSEHPLLRAGAPVTVEAARQYPVALFPKGAFPVFEQRLAALGFHSDYRNLASLAESKGEDPQRHEDLALWIASPLTLPLYGDGWSVLPLELGIAVGDVLMVHASFANHPRTQALAQQLISRLQTMAGGHNDVTLLDPFAPGRQELEANRARPSGVPEATLAR